MPNTKEISIGQLATRTGLAVSAIRYYEAQGLVTSNRNAGGQRRFSRATIRRLSYIIMLQKFGFTIARIRDTLAILPNARTPTPKDWGRLAQNLRQDLDAKIASLEAMRDTLDGCIGCGCLSMTSCKLYNPDDQAQSLGSGPRFLLGDAPSDLRSDPKT